MIKIDIEMPIYCYDCPCHNGENGRCQISGNFTPDKRPFDCPLTEVNKTPLVNVQEVKHGKWLCINGTIFCSECQEKALYKYNENDNDDFPFLLQMKSKRCPNCGAKMDEEKDKWNIPSAYPPHSIIFEMDRGD